MDSGNNISQKSSNFLLIILVSMIAFCAVVFLDIPIARQVIGFLYLTFVPGFVFLKLLKVDQFNGVETVLFSVGISVAFSMIFGFLINDFSLMIGFMEPLSVLPLMVIFNGLILIAAVLAHFRNSTIKPWNIGAITESPFVMLFLCLPLLSIIGTIFANVYAENLVLLFTVISIVLLVVAGSLSKKLLPPKLYPLAVVMIAIAILFHASLISNYILPFSSDIPGEYYLFKTTQNNGYWDSSMGSLGRFLGTYNDMLSITVLPTVYSNLLNLDGIFVFKIIYPLIFSLVPLGLYQIWQTQLSKKYAFLAVFLLVAQSTFHNELLGLGRQMIAELFFVMLILLILHKSIKPRNKMIYFIICSFALVTSHYALAEIFLILSSFIVFSMIFLKRPRKTITLNMVILFFVITFCWYIYTADSATFSTIVDKLNNVYLQLGNFLDPASRGQTVLTGLGLTESPSMWNTISRMTAYVTQGLISLGIIAFITKRSQKAVKKEYFLLSLAAMAFLGMLVVVPGLANTLNMTRFYHILLFFLAPLCVVGVEFIVKLFSNRQRNVVVVVLVLAVLVPYFLFQTNFAYEVTGSDSWSIPLSGYRMEYSRLYGHYGYTDVYCVHGAQWLSENVDFDVSTVYSDESSAMNILTIHSLLVGNKIVITDIRTLGEKDVVYLSTLNVVDDVFPYGSTSYNSSELAFSFDELNQIYTNGYSKIYQNP